MDNSFRVGVVSFTDPRTTDFMQEREDYLRERHQALISFLQNAGLTPVDPMPALRPAPDPIFGVRSNAEVRQVARLLQAEGAECLVIGCWHWTEPALPLALVRELALPVLLYTEDDPAWAGAVCISAVGSSLWEVGVNPYALRHRRVIGDPKRIIAWARGVCALAKLRRSTLLTWGGSYALRMEHLQDDLPRLKAFLVGDILNEGQSLLVLRAERIRTQQPQRISAFLEWLVSGGAGIAYDERMLTPQALQMQVALYLAARDRLRELDDEQVVGVSLRCQPELSEEYGVTGCLLPAFLPFAHDSEGPQPIMPTVCEGDIKGLITSALLALIEPGTPPLFGDLKYVGEETIVLANCGGASVYYAAYSSDPAAVLPRVRLIGQCQGAAGAAVSFSGPPSPVTVARLVRIGGQYLMHLGRGAALAMDEDLQSRIRWGQMWPHTLIHLAVPQQLLIEVVGSNHYCVMPGDLSAQVEAACEVAAIPVLHLDSADELSRFRKHPWGG